jgi:molybdenum cofactor cytidylyltransferase
MLQSTLMDADRQNQVSAIILAAGASTRMGQPKQLLPIDGQPMIRHTAETILRAGLPEVVAVVGAVAAPVARVLAGLPIRVVVNLDWRLGLSASVRTGIRAMPAGTTAVLLVLADQPTLRVETIQALIRRYHSTGAAIVAPYFQGRRGNPVLFDRSLFRELTAVRGDQGGKAVIQRHPGLVERLEVSDLGILLDIDSPQDLVRASDG